MHELAECEREDAQLEYNETTETSDTSKQHSHAFRFNSGCEIKMNEMDKTERLDQSFEKSGDHIHENGECTGVHIVIGEGAELVKCRNGGQKSSYRNTNP